MQKEPVKWFEPGQPQPRTVKQGYRKVPAQVLKRLAHRPVYTHWTVTHVDCEKCLANLALECVWAGIEDMAAWVAPERLEGPAVKRRRGRPGKGVQLPRRDVPEPTLRIERAPKAKTGRADDLDGMVDDWDVTDMPDEDAARLEELLDITASEKGLSEEEAAELRSILGNDELDEGVTY